jgi:uncharacterized protein (DUF1778 family)
MKNKKQAVVYPHKQTVLSDRDRDIFLKILDSNAKPDAALKKAMKEYHLHFGG